ncbi:sulfatase-like hydrolase/transferase [Paenibacillus cisolokensis]|uniref:sulfatase-like hydrolase/transferase n=1 Tax=Paenibacillus cisolokensis TaxID=1658519 RepID=UPI003D2CBFEA
MTRRPNVLVIMSDQHRYDCTGASGRYPVRTPNIDRLAEEGVWFANAYTPIPVCGPARQSFVCGRRPESFGALWNAGLGLPVGSLAPDAYSWARDLQQAGYATAYIGKWDVHPDADPTAFGYGRYVDAEREYAAYRRLRHPDIRLEGGWRGETDPVPLADSRTHWLADRARRMLRELSEADGPWHLRVNFAEPHLPCRPSEPFASQYNPADVPPWGSFGDTLSGKPYIQRQQLVNWGVQHAGWDEWAPVVARYYGIVSQMDDAVGLLLDALKEQGEEDNTVVVYTSDHGDMCGGHGMMDKHYVLYDDVVRVPLAIRWPGVAKPGTVCGAFVYNHLDLPPTLLDLLGLPLPPHLHGRSMRPLLEGEVPDDWRSFAVSTSNGQQFGLFAQRMIRTADWKYIWNPTDTDELYDLQNDPHERENRIAGPGCGKILSALRRELLGELRRTGDGLVAGHWLEGQLLRGEKL